MTATKPALVVTLPFPPSANRYWRYFRGRMVQSAEGKKYKQGVLVYAIFGSEYKKPLTGPVAVALNVYFPTLAGDLDNRAKVLLDALNGVAWVDDKQVQELHMYRHKDKARPRVEVQIWEGDDGSG